MYNIHIYIYTHIYCDTYLHSTNCTAEKQKNNKRQEPHIVLRINMMSLIDRCTVDIETPQYTRTMYIF